MFRRLATLGFPKKLLQATSAFYHTTTARLRIGVLLTTLLSTPHDAVLDQFRCQ